MKVLDSDAAMAGTFENLYTYADVRTAEMWRRRFLDLSTADAAKRAFEKLDTALMDESFEKLGTKVDFDRWWAAAGPAMEREFVRAGR